MIIKTNVVGGGGKLIIGDITTQDKSTDQTFMLCDGQQLLGDTIEYQNIEPYINNDNKTVIHLANPTTPQFGAELFYVNNTYIRCDYTTRTKLYVSTDLVNWTAKTTINNANGWTVYSVDYINGNWLVVLNYSSNRVLWLSTDNMTTWTQKISYSTSARYMTVKVFGDIVLANNSTLRISVDNGVTWDLCYSAQVYATDVNYNNGLYYFMSGNNVVKSTDLVNWTSTSMGMPNLTLFKGYFIRWNTYGKVDKSQDLTTWTTINTQNTSYSEPKILTTDNTLILFRKNGATGYYSYKTTVNLSSWTAEYYIYEEVINTTFDLIKLNNKYYLHNFQTLRYFVDNDVQFTNTNITGLLIGGNLQYFYEKEHYIVRRDSQVLMSVDGITFTSRIALANAITDFQINEYASRLVYAVKPSGNNRITFNLLKDDYATTQIAQPTASNYSIGTPIVLNNLLHFTSTYRNVLVSALTLPKYNGYIKVK